MNEEEKQEGRYLLFGGDVYYPAGGWDDFRGAFETIEAATAEGYRRKFDWFHVVDRETLTQVMS